MTVVLVAASKLDTADSMPPMFTDVRSGSRHSLREAPAVINPPVLGVLVSLASDRGTGSCAMSPKMVERNVIDSAAANIHITDTIPDAAAGSLTIEVDLPNGTASGDLDFDISVTDVNGLTSNDVTGVVDLDQ